MWLVDAPWRTFVIIVAVVDIHINIQHTHSFRMVVWAHCTHAVAGLKHCCWYSHWFIYLLRLFYIAFCSFVVAGWSCMSRWYENMYVYLYMAINLSKWSLATPVCVSSLSSVISLCLWPNDAYVVWQGFSFAQRSATEPAGNNTRDVHVSCAMCVSACERSKWHKPHTTHSSHTHTIRKKINDML